MTVGRRSREPSEPAANRSDALPPRRAWRRRQTANRPRHPKRPGRFTGPQQRTQAGPDHGGLGLTRPRSRSESFARRSSVAMTRTGDARVIPTGRLRTDTSFPAPARTLLSRRPVTMASRSNRVRARRCTGHAEGAALAAVDQPASSVGGRCASETASRRTSSRRAVVLVVEAQAGRCLRASSGSLAGQRWPTVRTIVPGRDSTRRLRTTRRQHRRLAATRLGA